MVTIATYNDLVTTATEYLGRDQDATLIARIPTFVQFAEAKFNRLLFCRQMEQRSTTTIDITQLEPEFIALPSDFQSMRRIRLSSITGKPRLDYKTGDQADEYRNMIGDAPGQPLFFTIFGNEIELIPNPDANYTVEMIYRQNLPSLISNPTNWLLTIAPDIYLYGALLESAPYIKDDDRIQVWALGFKTSLDALNDLAKTSTFNAGPLQMRISGPTP